MMTTRFILAIPAMLGLAAGLVGCNSASSGRPAPTASPLHSLDAVQESYHLKEIKVSGKEACPFDTEGKLLVFSESARAADDGTSLTVGNVTLKPGDTFHGPMSVAITATCGGTEYPARHIGEAGITQGTP